MTKKKTKKAQNSDIDWNKAKKVLFRAPNLNDGITLFIILMTLCAAWAYKHDIQVCGEVLAACEDRCYPNLANPQAPNWQGFGGSIIIHDEDSDTIPMDTR